MILTSIHTDGEMLEAQSDNPYDRNKFDLQSSLGDPERVGQIVVDARPPHAERRRQ